LESNNREEFAGADIIRVWFEPLSYNQAR
jgi:hypothetical protein